MLFCFLYIYFLHGEILNEAQFVYSKGITVYHPVISALIISGVLQIIQWLITRFIHLPSRWYALSYFPSILLFTMLADIDGTTIAHFTFGSWVWSAPLLVIIYALIVYYFMSNKNTYNDYELTITESLYPNHIILLVMILVAGSVPRSKDVYLFELKTERLVHERKYDEAVQVGERSLKANKRLTQLRMFALAKQDELGERIFDFPQYYGTKGLLDINDRDSVYRISVDDICRGIGAMPGASIKTTKRYLDLMTTSDSLRTPMAIDYSLCYLLLDKKLDEFCSEVFVYYNPDRSRLPKAYQEALIYKADIDGDSLTFIDKEIADNFRLYKQIKAENLDSTKRSNRSRRAYGNTFWWYYEN